MAISLTGGLYTENFDSLASSGATSDVLPTGWLFVEAGSNANTTYGINDGSSNTGNTYSYGAAGASDRAFGALASGSLTSTIGARFVNDTGSTITGLDISYVGEQWRSSTSIQNVLSFSYQVGAMNLTSGTWTTFSTLNLVGQAPVASNGALDGNANLLPVSGTITGLNVAAGEEIWIRWVDVNDAGSDAGLAIDNFSLTPITGGSTPNPVVTIAAADANAAESSTTVNTGAFTITRSGDTSADLTVTYTVGGSATNGTDYNALSGTVVIPAGQSSVTFTVTPVNDANATEGSETVELTLTDGAAYDLGSSVTATVTIEDNTAGSLKQLSTFTSATGAEIPAFDPASARLFVVAGSTVDIYTIGSTGALTAIGTLTPGFSAAGANIVPNSVAVKNGIVAVAYAVVNATTGAQELGRVSFYEAATGTFLNSVEVGYLPDMLTFTPDGTKVVTANEGEPNSYGQANSFDPEGSVSIIDLSSGVAAATVQTAGFTSFNGDIDALRAAGVRIIGPSATVAQDLEPEYIAFSGDGTKAYVTLQENNALAIVDIATATVTAINPLGLKDYSQTGNGIDASDRDGGINIQNWPVFGMYQPDAIASYTVGGQTYFITANEGDARDYTGFSEEIRVGSSSYVLDPTVFPNAATLKQNANLGRLEVTKATGDTNNNGTFDQIHSFGARSFSIWDSNGNRVFDSGDQLEKITAEQVPSIFNSNGSFTENTFDTRSDAKGPEPEGVVLGKVGSRTYAFIGLERTGDIMVYDVTIPTAPEFIEYINVPGDAGIEGLAFVSASDSPTGKPMLITTNEVSNTVSTFEFTAPNQPTLISTIQGTGTVSPLVGQTVTLEAIVVGDFQRVGETFNLRGFYVQEEDVDADLNPLTSEGLFVFDDNFGVDVNVGDKVRVTGIVGEFTSGSNSSLTQIRSVTDISVQSTGSVLPTAATVNFPVLSTTDLEAFEGMRVTIPTTLTVTEHFQLGRFGQVVLSSDGPSNQPGTDGRLDQYTQFNDPSVSGYSAYLQEIAKRRIVLDDGLTIQNPDPIVNARGGNPLSASNTLRGGDTVTGLSGILDDRFGDATVGQYRIQPVAPVDFQPTNPRPEETPDVGGRLKVASFNVLNYFNGDGLGGGFPTPRGAENALEFERQRNKTISAILGLNADVVGLIEMENDGFGPNSALQDLVNGLNAAAGAGTYAFIDAGVPQVGTDAITVAFIYKPASVTPVGNVAILDKTVDPRFDSDNQRPTLAQTFQENATGALFTPVINHLKSKGSSAGNPGDEDAGDGQGASNGTRTRGAEALVDWLATNPTGVADADYLIMGDLNAYAQEDPLKAIQKGADDTAGTADDYTNLLANSTYSFVFSGQWGSLDHALASGSLVSQVTGAAKWHINADEPSVLDYNTNFKSSGQIDSLYAPNAFRSSDHDPVVVGLNLVVPPSVRLTFGQVLKRLDMEATQDGVSLGRVRGRQNQAAPSVAPFTLFALDSADTGRNATFVDRTWLDQGEGIGIVDGDDGNSTTRKRIDGDEILGIQMTGFYAKDALINIDRVTSQDGAEIRVKALKGDAVVATEIFSLVGVADKQIQTLDFNSNTFFDTLQISAADRDTLFTFRSVELPTALAV